ncbi:MAG: SDR family oxidoreductase [Deltaproteobacteria bacterium]|nr:SDR family oxidoreductase [Deltaproteobacteria bacterium]
MRAANKVVVVTGAASGIGAATARLFASEGASVVVADLASTQSIVAEIREMGSQAIGVEGDLARSDVAHDLVERAVASFGRIDVLVNNAGVGGPGSIETTSEEDWDRVLAANVRSGFLCSKYALPHLRATGGVILFTASIARIEGVLQLVSYAASKAAIINLARAMALDHAREGIRVNVVCPGATDTPMLREGLEKIGVPLEAFASRLPTHRLVMPEEVAEAFLFLASNAARSITGQTLVIDGGFTAGDFGWVAMPRP